MKIILAFLLSLLVMLPASANELQLSKEEAYQRVDDFTKCAAIQNLLALTLSNTEEEYNNHFLHMAANGSKIAAQVLGSMGGYKEELVDSLYEVHYSRFIALLKSHLAAKDSEGWNKSILEPTLAYCAVLNELQAAIVQEVRKEAYSN